MKSLITVTALFCVLAKIANGSTVVQTKTLLQKLDHFDPSNNKTWQMRYMVNEKYFKTGGPMFLYLGGENEIEAPYIDGGILLGLAMEHNGILFSTEHRYYGESRPTSDLSTKNLKYLTIRQVLADIAHFIQHMRYSDSRLKNSKVFISGCSYAGSLAVWFNNLYPELVDGTWAISAPILPIVDFKEYYKIVGEAIKRLGSQKCYDRIKNGIAELEEMFYGDRADEAKNILNLCEYFYQGRNEKDLWVLFRAIAATFANAVVFPKKGQNITFQCETLMKEEDDLSAIAAHFKKNYRSLNSTCKDISFYADVYYYNKTSYEETKEPSRVWLYQMCNELGFFQSSGSKNQPFGSTHPIHKDIKLCSEVFGSEYTYNYINQLIERTGKVFGGLKRNIKNVYMTHCDLDPWSALGDVVSPSSSLVHNCSHCSHIFPIDVTDSPEMHSSKERVYELARKWLA